MKRRSEPHDGGRMTAALFVPPGSCSSRGKRKEGSVVFVVFYPFPVLNIKSPQM